MSEYYANGYDNLLGLSSNQSSSSNHHYSDDPRSFLFVINKLNLVDDDRLNFGDKFYNRLPPIEPNKFAGEIPGMVMRYQNGEVTKADGYTWFRAGSDGTLRHPGRVLRYGRDLDEPYKQLAVFACNPHLPIFVIKGDPLSATEPRDLARFPLLFFHPFSQPGISQAVHPDSPMGMGPGLCKYVAGLNPSWMPGLVPTTYINPYKSGSVTSKGLAGELPIILGLMAFSEPAGKNGEGVIRTFLGDGLSPGKWRNGQWCCSDAPQGYPLAAKENPLGFLVTVHLDPENREHSTEDILEDMQWKEPIVREVQL